MIKVTLTAANMGDVDDKDFDCWAEFVTEKIDEATGLTVEVDQARFGDAGDDVITGATENERDAILRFLGTDGWDAFCGEEWDRRRDAKDAAILAL